MHGGDTDFIEHGAQQGEVLVRSGGYPQLQLPVVEVQGAFVVVRDRQPPGPDS